MTVSEQGKYHQQIVQRIWAQWEALWR